MHTFIKECKWGRFLLLRGDMISQYVDLYGEWCELEVALFARLLRRDSNVIEIGSHIGMHAVPLSKIASEGKVVCFEPQRVLYNILSANCALNDRINIHAHNCAVGNTNGSIDVRSTDYETPWNYGSFSVKSGFNTEGQFGGASWHERVGIQRLSDIPLIDGLEALRLVKIDVEGMESEVLRGAEAVIAKHRPVLFVENNSATSGDSLILQIRDLGYECYWYCANRFRPDNYNRVHWQVSGSDINMVCFPDKEEGKALGLTPATHFSDIKEGKVTVITKWTNGSTAR